VSGWEQDGQTDAVLKIMKMCRNDASRSQAASDSVVAINFYSIGNFKQGDQTCLGLLVEISAQTSAKNKAYELKGAKACTSFSVDMERLNVFHPEVRPSGIPYGNVIVDTYAYSGMVPTRYTYKGSQYDFYSDEFKSKALSSVSTAQEGAYQAERSSSGRDLDKGSAPEQRYSDVGGPAISAIGESAIVKHQDEDPAATLPALLVSPAPVYPSRALSRGLDGSVTLEFTINPDGSTAAPIVVESTSSLFERAASRAILKRRYESTARKVTGVRDTVQFRLSN